MRPWKPVLIAFLCGLFIVWTFVDGTLISRLVPARGLIDDNTAMYLSCGRLILDGKVPYIDFFDLNPPLIMYLSALPVWLSQFVYSYGFSTAGVFTCLVLIVALTSFAFAFGILRDVSGRNAWLIGFLAFNLITLSHGEWGERDHLFVLLVFPYCAARAGCRTSIMASLAAGLALCIKPQCIILPLFIEIAYVLVGKGFALKSLLALLVAPLIYGIALAAMPPASLRYLFAELLPLLISSYAAYNLPTIDVLQLASAPGATFSAPIFFALVISAYLLWFGRKDSLDTARICALAWCLAGYVVYVMQGKGWHYQSAVLESGVCILATLLIADLKSRFLGYSSQTEKNSNWRSWPLMIAHGLVNCAGFILLIRLPLSAPGGTVQSESFRALRKVYDEKRIDLEFVGKYSHDQILVLSADTFPSYPLIFDDFARPVRWESRQASRYLWCYPLVLYQYQAMKRPESAEEARRKITFVIDCIAEDVSRSKPRLIALEHTVRPEPWFSIEPLILSNERLAAVLKNEYRRHNTAGGFTFYLRE